MGQGLQRQILVLRCMLLGAANILNQASCILQTFSSEDMERWEDTEQSTEFKSAAVCRKKQQSTEVTMCPFAGHLVIHSGNGKQLGAPSPIYYYRERPVGRIWCNFYKWTMWASTKWLNHPRYTGPVGQGHSGARVGPTQLSCTHKTSPTSSSPLPSPPLSLTLLKFPRTCLPHPPGSWVTPADWLLAIGAFVPQIGFKFTHLKS